MKKVMTKLGEPVKRVPKVKPQEYTKPLKLGDKGPVIQFMVLWLQQKGSSVKATNVFHIGVRSAVVCFQKKNGLKPTGIVDKKTWTKLTAK
jgi:peptidoglycan hydrolase-like protein with peptidoglycan-binding domain